MIGSLIMINAHDDNRSPAHDTAQHDLLSGLWLRECPTSHFPSSDFHISWQSLLDDQDACLRICSFSQPESYLISVNVAGRASYMSKKRRQLSERLVSFRKKIMSRHVYLITRYLSSHNTSILFCFLACTASPSRVNQPHV
ncbi:hypothetical protein CEXT_653031 [Caerostris extrusa]|uniref:Uncharacterized protein n=1 Tax=Caerostris extrusa TaxID=172846 RepID=A0AAV4QK06_CAEEX|nr:hypothetical protein CEXT_653031 [Caerostris extrusa]